MKFTKISPRIFASLALLSGVALHSCAKVQTTVIGGTCTNASKNASSAMQTYSTNSNVIPVYIADSSVTGSEGYQNEPLVSVTVCSPGHTSASQCSTISNILLDTGSFGLRVFASAIGSNVSLHQQTFTVGSTTLNQAECATFGSGADWGSIQTADLIWGNKSANNVPIQVIDYNFSLMPTSCKQLGPDTDPCTAGFNGIIGVGPFPVDCGADCAGTGAGVPTLYYGCNSTGCYNANSNGIPFTFSTATQVTNPVTAMGLNGVSLTLPAISSAGASGVQGSLTLGIAANTTQSAQSTFSAFNVYPAYSTDEILDMTTLFISQSNSSYYGSGDPSSVGATTSFIDSGSNGVYVPLITGLIKCGDGSGFYCPTSTQNLSANLEGYSSSSGSAGTPTSGAYSFSIANSDTLFNSGHSAFNNLGGDGGSTLFDWGLPFFYGKTIYVGISGSSATFNGNGTPHNGPFWAF